MYHKEYPKTVQPTGNTAAAIRSVTESALIAQFKTRLPVENQVPRSKDISGLRPV